MDHLQGWRQNATDLPHAVPAPHYRHPVVRLCNQLGSHRKDRSTKHTCSHQWQKAGSVRTCETPARKHWSTWRPSSVGWVTCRHGTTFWLAKKARKAAMFLVTWRSESDTFSCSVGLDSGWWSGEVKSATVHRWLGVPMMMMMMMVPSLPGMAQFVISRNSREPANNHGAVLLSEYNIKVRH